MDRKRSDPDARSRQPAAAPRLLAFYRDVVDDDLGAAVGWQTVAWGLALPDGSAISVPVESPVAVTVWRTVDEATSGLDAYVDTVEPRPRLASLSGRLASPGTPATQPSAGATGR